MEKCFILTALLTVVPIVSAAGYNSSSMEQNNTVNNFTQIPRMTKDFGMLAKRIIMKKCIIDYSFTCLKMDLVKLIDRLNSKGRFQIIPGLSMIKNSGRYKSSLPSWLLFYIAQGKKESLKELDLVLLHKLEDFIKSFSIELQPEDPLVLQYIKNLGHEIINTLSTVKNNQTGRGKKGAILWSAGVLAALGFAAVAAVAGKALMASILALMISALSTLRSGGSGSAAYKTAHYEIISKPVHYSAPAITGPAHYYDHDHLHSSSYSPAYDYARTISDTIVPVAEEAYVKDSNTSRTKHKQNIN